MPRKIKAKNYNPMSAVVSGLFRLNVMFGFFSFVIMFAVSAMFETAQTGLLAASAASCALFCCSFYLSGWHYGSRDHSLEPYGRSRYKSYNGALAGLFSQLPGLAAVCLAAIFYGTGGYMKYSGILQQVLYSPFSWLFSIFKSAAPQIFFLPVFLMPAFSCAGYLVGHTGKPLFMLLFPKDGGGSPSL